jgi:hypothetical protein
MVFGTFFLSILGIRRTRQMLLEVGHSSADVLAVAAQPGLGQTGPVEPLADRQLMG